MLTLKLRSGDLPKPWSHRYGRTFGAVGPRMVASMDRDESRVGLMAYRR
jgi:hypothetical protein